jgi:hypothetical protein
MSVPFGAITTSAVSLVSGVKNPTATNLVGAATQLASLGNNQKVTNSVNAGASLAASFVALGQGRPFDTLGGVNQAVRLASGFMDPKTAAITNSVLTGVNMLFGGGGVFGAPGNKPYALHTDSLPSQDMGGAYGEGNDVVFSFVRADAAMEEAMSGSSDWTANLIANTDGEGNYLGTPPAPGSSADLVNKYSSPAPPTTYVSSAPSSDLDRYSPL